MLIGLRSGSKDWKANKIYKTSFKYLFETDTAPNCAQDLQKGLPGYVGWEGSVMDLHLCGFCAETLIWIKVFVRIFLARAMPHSQFLPPYYQSCIERRIPPPQFLNPRDGFKVNSERWVPILRCKAWHLLSGIIPYFQRCHFPRIRMKIRYFPIFC